MQKKKNIELSKEEQISDNSCKIILSKKNAIKRVTNSELVTLFWKIGYSINKSIENETHNRSISRIISSDLRPTYGAYFTPKNIERMQQFAASWPKLTMVGKFKNFVGWEHLMLLLTIKDTKAQQFYLNLKIEQGLNINELKKVIISNAYRKFSQLTAFDNNTLMNSRRKKKLASINKIPEISLELFKKNDNTHSNLFKPLFTTPYRFLMQPNFVESDQSTIKNKLSLDIIHLIANHSHKQNRWLNTNFNLLFWEIGKTINESISIVKNDFETKSIIDYVSKHLMKFSSIFTGDELKSAIAFAQKYKTMEEALSIVYFINWEQIKPLLVLQDEQTRLYVASMAAEGGTTSKRLNKIIENQDFSNEGAKLQSRQALSVLQKPVVKTANKTKRNSTATITTIDYTLNTDHTIVPDVFKNTYFIGLMNID